MEPDDLGHRLHRLLLRDRDGRWVQDRSNGVDDCWFPIDVCLLIVVAFHLAHVGSQAETSTSGRATTGCCSADYGRITTRGTGSDDFVAGSCKVECGASRLDSEH